MAPGTALGVLSIEAEIATYFTIFISKIDDFATSESKKKVFNFYFTNVVVFTIYNCIYFLM